MRFRNDENILPSERIHYEAGPLPAGNLTHMEQNIVVQAMALTSVGDRHSRRDRLRMALWISDACSFSYIRAYDCTIHVYEVRSIQAQVACF